MNGKLNKFFAEIFLILKYDLIFISAPKLNQTTAAEIVHRVLTLLSGFGLSINGKQVYCGDYIYSGHTMILVTGYLVISECK